VIQNLPSGTGEEVNNQTINSKRILPFLPATQLKEIKLTNMSLNSSSTKECILQTAASLENKRNDILQQQRILNDWAEQCRAIDVSKRIENAQELDCTTLVQEGRFLETDLAHICYHKVT
jgi:ABC-type metal ion transport system substrate-binding protein